MFIPPTLVNRFFLKFVLNFFQIRVVFPQVWSWFAVQFRSRSEKYIKTKVNTVEKTRQKHKPFCYYILAA